MSDIKRTAYGGINPHTSLLRCLQLCNSLAPDALLITGDISGDDSVESYAHFTALLASHCPSVPFKVIPGNHDVNPHFNQMLKHATLIAGSAWQLGQWHIHGMDSTYTGTRGQVDNQQLDLISQAVAAHPGVHHLAALHHHLLPTNSWMDTHALENAGEVRAWFTRQRNIQAIIYGHIHAVREHTVDDRAVLSAPSSCWQWRMTADFGVDNIAPGVRVLDLAPDGTMTTFIRRIE
ncbi:3',5'-cyclic-nucleotide phosphodiesterase [Salinimonas sp. HHU 13199]|uniref:3',5'-cyclic-nucleotide phosphodiesterase n=1 Tax=Salinimonas profundi TaxID=2729140 RepID=A0ABR8LNL2_9ALTE|nr:3',5'-cyclic-nucleotide phosphodiesterase [Salinimonas profundi]